MDYGLHNVYNKPRPVEDDGSCKSAPLKNSGSETLNHECQSIHLRLNLSLNVLCT